MQSAFLFVTSNKQENNNPIELLGDHIIEEN